MGGLYGLEILHDKILQRDLGAMSDLQDPPQAHSRTFASSPIDSAGLTNVCNSLPFTGTVSVALVSDLIHTDLQPELHQLPPPGTIFG